MIRRRSVIAGLGAMLGVPNMSAFAASDVADDLLAQARLRAEQPYSREAPPLPPPFAGLTYDAYRGIRPRPGKAADLDQGAKWVVDLLPPGLYFPDPVRIDLVGPEGLRNVPFSPGLFTFEPRYFDTVPETAPGAGFSGLRLRHPLNTPDRMDEVMVMQGASYFRAIGQAMAYGLSARGVAIGTGRSGPEEFPRFVHLRVHPGSEDSIRLEGVIDGPSLAGHLDLILSPGKDTTMQVGLHLFPRVDIPDIGIAPLTSMYLKGPLHSAVSDDFRPRVHDRDVLLIENGQSERLWRPIANPAVLQISAFMDKDPASFGLFQSARRFEDYQDTEARYHDRPSARVHPREDWGPGAVMLVEIPTADEFMDNIVAFWRPAAPLEAGQEYRFAYDLVWTSDQPTGIIATRSGREHDRPGTRRFVIDIEGPADGLTASVTASGDADITGTSLFALPEGRGTRVTFLLAPGEARVVDVRLMLTRGDGGPTHPVWLHRWTPARDGGV